MKKYHYLSPLKNGNHNFKDAVRIFQEFVNIPNTGQLDRKTIAEMHKPRCGVPDFDDDDKPSPGKTYCNLRDWSFFIPCIGKVGGGGGGRREGYYGDHMSVSVGEQGYQS